MQAIRPDCGAAAEHSRVRARAGVAALAYASA